MITELEVGGIPALLAPTTGPMHAGLAFRVGMADEPLARRGITHLVEHLALHSAGVADYHYNGATGVRFTYFHMQGSETDVVKFLNGVCASLRELPMDRLAVEKEILRTEAGGRGGSIGEPLAIWRYGARDYGTPGFGEFGRGGLTPDDLRAWVGRYFTAGNAVLWVAGDRVPDGLELELPAGPRRPLPAASSALPERPAYFTGGDGSVAWTATVPRSPASSLFTGVLERAMLRSLRQESGLSYKVETDYEPHTDGTAVLTAYADALPEKQSAVLGGFIDVLAAMRVGRVDPADLTTVATHVTETLRRAEEQGARLPGQAFNLLTGRPVQDVETAVTELREVTPEQITEVAVAAWNDGLLMTPRGTRADWAGLTAAPTGSDAAVPGTGYPSLEDPSEQLVAGPDGVSVVDGDRYATVRFDACEAVFAWPDGARRLIGSDAVSVTVEPTMYAGAAAVTALVDAAVPAERRITMPARERIPQPEPRETARPAKPVSAWTKVSRTFLLLVLVPVAIFMAFVAVVMAVELATGGEDQGVNAFLLIMATVITVGAIVGIVQSVRRLFGR